MKLPFALCALITIFSQLDTEAQIGIGTTSPNSTLDVRGSLSFAYRTITASTTLGVSDNVIGFTGNTTATVTLPDATTCAGRTYWIKNASTTVPVPALTIATTSSQKIDGASTWVLDEGFGVAGFQSNGNNWYVIAQAVPGTSGSAWLEGGNNVTGIKNLGTIANYDLPIITNNTEKMRISAAGNVGIGSSSFNATNPEQLLVNAGNTSSFNVISGKGSINNYLQLNIQNLSSGNGASSDVVATSDNGNESVNYVDMGINSSTYNAPAFNITGINDAYLYSAGNDFAIGNSTSAKSLKFFTGGTVAANERMRITGTGSVGIGTTSPSSTLDVRGSLSFAYRTITASTTLGVSDNVIGFTGNTTATVTLPDATTCAGRTYWIKNASTTVPVPALTIATTSSQKIDGASTWVLDEGFGVAGFQSNGNNWYVIAQAVPGTSGSAWLEGGNNVTGIKNLGTIANYDLPIITNNTEKMRISAAGNVGIGSSSFNATNPEQLLVNAGNTSSFNVISGKGSINNYLQLNIQNLSSGNGASSDVVATSDNGNESVNYVDMGINSSTYNAPAFNITGINDAYLYSAGNDFAIGNSTSAKSLKFFTGGTVAANERMRITGTGSVGIGTTSPSATLDVSGTYKLGAAGTVLSNMIKTNVSLSDATTFTYTATRQLTITVTGANSGATVILNPRSALPTGIGIAYSYVSSANTITIGFTNTDATARAVGSIILDVTVIQ